MIKKTKGVIAVLSTSIISALLLTSTVIAAETSVQSNIETGKKIAFQRKKGNCLACHMIMGGASPGSIAPPLIAMKSRYPDKLVLKEQIWDASLKNPETIMPAFGRHEVLTNDEINKLVDYIYSL